MSRYCVIITLNDREENFSKEEVEQMVTENMLDHIDNSPFELEKLEVKRLF